jgi:hypothetical protein
MPVASTLGRRARAVALLTLGALALHQARYLLAYGEPAAAGDGHRHSYLELLAPPLVGAIVATIALTLLAAALRRRSGRPLAPACATERAALFALALLAVYFVQEISELLAASHSAGLEAMLGAGGWLVMPLAIALGAVSAFLADWLDRVELRFVGASGPERPRAPRTVARPSVAWVALLASPLAFGLARRPPPVPASG